MSDAFSRNMEKRIEPCPYCGYPISSDAELSEHIRMHMKNEQIQKKNTYLKNEERAKLDAINKEIGKIPLERDVVEENKNIDRLIKRRKTP